MSVDSNELAALIGSRICHDLISPIGAINNGIELLNMSGELPGPEMELISESVGSASARIRFFRIAFGAAGEQMMGRAEVVSILRDLYGSARHKIDWKPTDPQPRASVRLAFLSILCLETGMPYGGRVTVNETDGEWLVMGKADKINIDEDLWTQLQGRGRSKSLLPAQVQFALLPALALDEDRKVRVASGATEIKIRF